MGRYSIGLDLGTSSVKAVLFSENGGIASSASCAFEYRNSKLPCGSEYLGIDLERFYSTVCKVIKELSKKIPENAEFLGLAMASASGNAVLCDENGNPLIDGYSWLNGSFEKEIESVFGEDFGKDVIEDSGWGLAPSFPLGQLSHVKCHAPKLLESAKTVCMTTEYVLHRLTGVWGCDVSTATPSYLLDQKKRAWNDKYLKKLGIREENLPPLFESGAFLGKINESASRDTGLPVGSNVYLASFDHPTAARACGISEEGDLLISCGTSWVCFFPMNEREKIIENGFLCDPFLSPRGPWGAMASLARASEKIKEVVEKYISDGEDKFKALDECVRAAKGDTGGIFFNPCEEIPDLLPYSKEHIARALMVGIAKALKESLKNAVKIKRISMCGGPSASKMWQKVLAEVFEAPLTVTYGAYSGAVGAAMYALR